MQIYTSLDEAKLNISAAAAALGNFDGVHRGHQQLISRCVELAEIDGISSLVFTFQNHPSNVMAGKNVVKNIMSPEEKARAIEALGVDILVTVPFDSDMMTMSPEAFAEKVLSKSLKLRHAVCGFNYSFGYRAQGTPELLSEYGSRLGFGVSVLPEFDIEGHIVSSTYIRQLLALGDIPRVNLFSGRPYSLSGVVVTGQKIGHSIGFPTLNLELSAERALPMKGVYITKTYVNNTLYPSVTNVGTKPSVGSFSVNAETHLLDFSGDLYGSEIRVEFLKLIRPEIKFASLDELKDRIAADCRIAEEYHGLEK